MMDEVGIAVTAAVAVWAFYRLLESKWPAAYFSAESRTDPIVNRTLPRYALWRLGPVFVGALAVSVTLDRFRDNVLLGATIFLALHLLSTLGRAVASPEARENLAALIVLGTATTFGCVAVTLGAVALRDALAGAVPQPSDLLQALWLGGFAAVGAATLSRFGGTRPTGELVRISRSELPDRLRARAIGLAEEYDTDPRVVEAVMLVENLKRPGWLRRVERIVGRVRKGGSYGVMQVHSDRPLSDEQSLEEAVRRFLAAQQIAGTRYDGMTYRSASPVGENIASYNPSEEWKTLVVTVLDFLTPGEGFRTVLNNPAGSTRLGPSNHPAVCISEAELIETGVRLKGWTDGFDSLDLCVVDAQGNTVSGAAIALGTLVDGTVRWFEHWLTPPDGAAAIVLRSIEQPPAGELRPACRFTLPQRWREALAATP
jgi:hypothetical protein